MKITQTVWFTLLLLLVANFGIYAQKKKNPAEAIVKRCILRHGGKKFTKVRDFYAKMDIVAISDQGEIESLVHQYVRFPGKLRAEIHPLVDPPTTISWDGKNSWQLVKDKLRASNDKQKQQLQDSFRFLKLMVLTNLLEEGSKVRYIKRVKPKSKGYGFYVVEQTDASNEKIKLFIQDKDFTLLGAEFYWPGAQSLLKVFFDEPTSFGGLYLPRYTRLYKGNKLVLKVTLRLARFNKLANGDSFFTNLFEKAKLPVTKKGRGRGRRN